MYAKTVLDLDGDAFEDALDAAKVAKGSRPTSSLDADDLRGLVATFKRIVEDETGAPFPSTLASSAEPCSPSSARGTPTVPSSTAAASASPRIWAPP